MARPRSFDEEEALDRAMQLFWRHGYEGTSVDALTRELGIAKPSLYAAFGNKRALFDRVVDRYAAAGRAKAERAMEEPSARVAVRRFLLELITPPADAPPGCLLVSGAIACSEEAAEVQAFVAERRRGTEQVLARRLARAQREGEIGADVKTADLARFFATVAHGLAVQGASGASAAQLKRVAEVALEAWPKAA